MSTTTRTDTAAGPVWLPSRSADHSRDEHIQGAWSLVIERWRVIGRIGWQVVSETYPAEEEVLSANRH